jgi:hypothetical protein
MGKIPKEQDRRFSKKPSKSGFAWQFKGLPHRKSKHRDFGLASVVTSAPSPSRKDFERPVWTRPIVTCP